MDEHTAQFLVDLDNRFYRRVAEAFSETRQAPWTGWDAVAECIAEDLPGKCLACPKLVACSHAPQDATTVSVLDLACGNLRFESYLEQRLPHLHFRFLAVDNCATFPERPVAGLLRFREMDIIEHLLADNLVSELAAAPSQVATSFGFMHHIPGRALRERFLNRMVDLVVPGGLACVSLWNFMQDPKLAGKARETTDRAVNELEIDAEGLEEGDFVLGWQNEPGVYRYCHSFDEDEVEDLAASVEPRARAIRCFTSDGRNGKMNTYLVLQRN